MKQEVFKYTDYRKFLHDYYQHEKKKNKRFTYRYLAEHVGFKSAGQFTKIIKAETNISIELALRFARFMKFTRRQTNYFQNMVLFNQAKTSTEKKTYFDNMLSYKEAQIRLVGTDKYEFYEKWYYSVIREILAYFPFKDDYATLSNLVEPPITQQEAQKAITVLEKLNFIVKDGQGFYKQVTPLISANPELTSVALNNYIISSLDIAKRAIDIFSKKERMLSATLITVSPETMQEIIRRTREFRKEIQKLAEGDQDPQKVHMLMFEIFPVSKAMQNYNERGED